MCRGTEVRKSLALKNRRWEQVRPGRRRPEQDLTQGSGWQAGSTMAPRGRLAASRDALVVLAELDEGEGRSCLLLASSG